MPPAIIPYINCPNNLEHSENKSKLVALAYNFP